MTTIFEQIVTGKVPCYKVYEDQNYFVFLDIHPRSKGHTLVIPKQPYRWVWDVPNFGEYLELCKKISQAITKALKPELVSLYTYGNDVLHAHVHLIPKYFGDTENVHTEKQFSPQEMNEIAQSISKMLP